MAVISVKWQSHRSRSGFQNDGSVYAEEYVLVTCDSDTDSTSIWGATSGGITAPVYGSVHPANSILYCNQTQYTPCQENTRRIFEVRAQYTDTPIFSPLSLPPEITWDFSEDGQVPYFLDCSTGTAKPVVNSAGELFADYLTRANGGITASFSVNLTPAAASAMAQTLTAYMYPVPAVNNGNIAFDGLTVSSNQARIKGATIGGVQKQLLAGVYIQYRNVKFNLAFKQNWQDSVDDRGYNVKWTGNPDGSTTLKEIIKGVPPVKPDRPWPLDGTGAAKPNITDAPAQLTFQPYPMKDFSVFNFV